MMQSDGYHQRLLVRVEISTNASTRSVDGKKKNLVKGLILQFGPCCVFEKQDANSVITMFVINVAGKEGGMLIDLIHIKIHGKT
jgi:hypothetical protein